MYVIKNALRNIIRNKGRNILIMIIALVIALSACIALSIRQSAESTRESTLSDMEITANISVDRSKMMKNATSSSSSSSSNKENMKSALQNTKDLSIDELEKYAKCKSVKDFYYTQSASLDASGSLEAVDTSSNSDSSSSSSDSSSSKSSSSDSKNSTDNNSNTPPDMQGGNGGQGGPEMKGGMGSQGDFTVIGYSSESAMTDFIDGTSKITDGSMFDINSSDKKCLISSELATLNSLEVGDTIKLQNPNDEDETITFTISGIYTKSDSSSSSENMMGFNASNDPANQIYTSYKCLSSIIAKSEKNASTSTDSTTGMKMSSAIRGQVNGTYVFSSVDDYNSFQKEAKKAGLSSDYTIQSQDLTEYENSLVPLENLSSFAGWFLLIVLIIGAIILIVFNMFNIRNRKYEIGVLTAIGMKKWKVALQFLTETFIVTFVAIILGAIIGACTSVPITNALLENQVTSSQTQQTQVEQNFGRGSDMQNSNSNSSDNSSSQDNKPSDNGQDKGNPPSGGFMGQASNYISSVSSATDLMVVLELILLGLGLTIVSSLTSVIFVMRYEPLKILSQRD